MKVGAPSYLRTKLTFRFSKPLVQFFLNKLYNQHLSFSAIPC